MAPLREGDGDMQAHHQKEAEERATSAEFLPLFEGKGGRKSFLTLLVPSSLVPGTLVSISQYIDYHYVDRFMWLKLEERTLSSKTIVLIHGAWHGGWCWNKVVPLLEAAGYVVYAPTLPGHDPHRDIPLEKVTLHAYSSAVGDILETLEEPAILVGHSMGGIVLSQVAERWPEKLDQLIYVTAILPPAGSTLMELMSLNTADVAQIEAAMRIDRQHGMCTLDLDQVGALLYHDCSPEDIAYAQAHLCPQALVPLLTPIETTQARFGRIARSYIECLDDRVLSLDMQRALCAEYPCLVRRLHSGHSPFFSQPVRLVDELLALIDSTHELTVS